MKTFIKNTTTLKAIRDSNVIPNNSKLFDREFAGKDIRSSQENMDDIRKIVDLMISNVSYACNVSSLDVYLQAYKAWRKYRGIK